MLDNIDAIAHIPGVLIHGRLDVSGPVETAWELHRRWPASRLVVIETEGHGGPLMGEAMEDAYATFLELSRASDYSSTPRIAAATAFGTFSSNTLGMM